jgi:hypothetical protein
MCSCHHDFVAEAQDGEEEESWKLLVRMHNQDMNHCIDQEKDVPSEVAEAARLINFLSLCEA